jgi:hypothetical protein
MIATSPLVDFRHAAEIDPDHQDVGLVGDVGDVGGCRARGRRYTFAEKSRRRGRIVKKEFPSQRQITHSTTYFIQSWSYNYN